MINFKEFVDAFAEVYNLQDATRKQQIKQAVAQLSEILEAEEDFRVVLKYIDTFMFHYRNMKKSHLEAEVSRQMQAGDTFFEACYEWDI